MWMYKEFFYVGNFMEMENVIFRVFYFCIDLGIINDSLLFKCVSFIRE